MGDLAGLRGSTRELGRNSAPAWSTMVPVGRPIGGPALGLSSNASYELDGCVPPPPRLAVVGSRACHRSLACLVPALVQAAGELGFCLVSGGALGIDGQAHAAALNARVPQLAVLPCGSDRPYPPAHHGLFAQIVRAPASGLLYAQPRGRTPSRSMFASRNRIVVGLADAVLVVEAAPRSGSLGTGMLALARGVPLAVVSGSRGCAALAAAGAHRLPASPGEASAALRGWLDAVRRGARVVPEPRPWPHAIAWLRDAIEQTGSRGLCLDHLPDRLAAVVALTEAESRGLVQEIAPGRWLLV